MKIDGISLQAQPFIKPKTQEPVETEVENTLQAPPEPAQIEEPPSTEPQSESKENDTEKGVIRNLLAGHYKGVSDVRLRINFFEELAAIEAAEVRIVTVEKVGGVLESVGGVVNSFITGENKPADEQIASVLELQETFTQAAGESQNEPAADLTSAFDDFVKGLRDLFAPPVKTPEETTIPETEDDGITESSNTTELPWQTFLENLQSAFTAASDELTKAVTELNILPELSEPNGNGVAYEKFLAIYNDLSGLGSPAAEQPVSEPVDVVV
ncbi:MAG: hypothetical protein RQ760_07475 [Sedimentisphaerales bacterium]|nr:hypothetical protein [Sedimentisphaerales bacterium]